MRTHLDECPGNDRIVSGRETEARGLDASRRKGVPQERPHEPPLTQSRYG
jgi:hypothetical protein